MVAQEAARGAEEKARQLEGWLTEAEDQLAASNQAAAAQLAQVSPPVLAPPSPFPFVT